VKAPGPRADLRTRAKAKVEEEAPAATQADAHRLLHELRIHQVELELQNEALRESQEDLKATLDNYLGLYQQSRRQATEMGAVLDAIPDAIVMGTAEGFTRCNPTALRMLGLQSLPHPLLPWAQIMERGSMAWAGLAQPTTQDQHPFFRALRGETVITEAVYTPAGPGAAVPMRCMAAPIREGGQVVAAVCVLSDLSTTKAKVRLEAENAYLHREMNRDYDFGPVVGQSSSLERVFRQVHAVAPQDTTVLLLGETGTGKGLVAHAIHQRSLRHQQPMVTVTCTALPANLIESELFGREKGAFTGATAQQIGRFELADHGTILLDEIGDLPLELQAKLLQVIQDGEFSRLGSPRTLKADVRIIASTNRNLLEEVRQGRFREDLYYRLNIFPIALPPLRERSEDIPLLVAFFLAKYNKKIGRRIETVPQAAMEALMAHSWPGNVRELESVIERAVIITQGHTLQLLDRFQANLAGPRPELPALKPLREAERDHIRAALAKCGGRIEGQGGAAELLGLNPSTLRGRMRKDGLHR